MAFVLRQLVKSTLQRNCVNVTSQTLRYASAANTATTKEANFSAANTSTPAQNKTQLTLLVSESCKQRLREICTDGSFLRIMVEGGGCSGFQYKFDVDTKLNEDDLQFGDEHAKVVIDETSLEYCNGATIDYHTELIRAGFRMLANPLAEQGCSCGSSFSIKL